MREQDYVDVVEESFENYSAHVIQERAIVDVRDAIKPSSRQALYAQFLKKFLPNKPYRKALESVGVGLGLFYTHGDASLYGLLVRMGQPFSMRYVLEDVQGNYGSMKKTGDYSAARYLEMRLSHLGASLFDGIDKDTILKWYPNYNDTENFPAVLPSLGYYNIVNGTLGIGVAIASSIPQFNLREVNKAISRLILNPETPFDDIYCVPDFSTGATIINPTETKESLRVGNGKAVKLRATMSYDTKEHAFTVTEMPYSTFTTSVVKQIYELKEKNPLCGIERVNDLTQEEPNMKIYLTKKANPGAVKRLLYKETSLHSWYGINMVMLYNGTTPRIFGWKEALLAHIDHSKNVLHRYIEFDLAKTKVRFNIVKGFLKAYPIIDDIIREVKASTSTADAISRMVNKFVFNEVQAKAILDMKLARLSKLDLEKYTNEHDELEKLIDHYENLLLSESLRNTLLSSYYDKVAEQFGDDRRTKVEEILDEEEEEVIEQKDIVLVVTAKGDIGVRNAEEMRGQKRGGKGAALKLPKGDQARYVFYGNTTDSFIAFTSLGRSYKLSISELEAGQMVSASLLLKLQSGEQILSIANYNDKTNYLVVVTKGGMIKKTRLEDCRPKTQNGLVFIKLKDGDQVVNAMLLTENAEVVIATHAGKMVKYEISTVNEQGKAAQGVKGITLKDGDYVVGADSYIKGDLGLLVLDSDGKGKITDISEILNTRTNIGVQIVAKDKKCLTIATQHDQVSDFLISTPSNILRVPVAEFPTYSRTSIGVKIIDIHANSQVKAQQITGE